MPKTIKFNLILDGKPIRNIKGLQDNFCIDDMITVYENGLLEKWLKVRGFEEYLGKVKKIKKNDEVIKQLIKIFKVEKSEKEIMEGIYSLSFWNERKADIEKWDKKNNKVKQIIADYHKGYYDLKENISEKEFDMPFLKQTAKKIYSTYLEIFKIDYKYFFDDFVDEVPLMIFAILMNENLRDLFLNDELIVTKLNDALVILESKDNLSTFFNNLFDYDMIIQEFDENTEKNENGDYLIANRDSVFLTEIDGNMSNSLWVQGTWLGFSNEVEYYNLKEVVNKILYFFSGQTDGYWKDIEPKNKKFMIISMEEGNFVRNAAKQGEELSASDVNGNFPILNGIDYKSNNANHKLIYMEV